MNFNHRRDPSIRVGRNDMLGLVNWFVENYGVMSTSAGKLNCNGNSLYSYGICIATMNENKDGYLLSLVTSVIYSTTTSKHCERFKYVCPTGLVEVPNVMPRNDDDHLVNMSHLMQSARSYAQQCGRFKAERLRGQCANEVRNQLNKVVQYSEHFKQGRTSLYKQAKSRLIDVESYIKEVNHV